LNIDRTARMSADVSSTHLAYLFPSVAYLLELVPAKGTTNFQVQNVREIRGSFCTDGAWQAENIKKLASKLDTAQYTVALPDTVFQQYVFEVEAGSEAEAHKKALRHMREAYEIDDAITFCHLFLLSTHRGKYTFQLVSLPQAAARLFYDALSPQSDHIKAITPLSWLMKAFVSLEPSLTLAQVGQDVSVARHYIGIDRTFSGATTQPTALAEYLKSQKIEDAQLQTLYLIADEETERLVKKDLNKIIPIQQLITGDEAVEGLPASVKFLAEQAARTLSLTELRLPLIKVEELEQAATNDPEELTALSSPTNRSSSETSEDDASPMSKASLPAPTLPNPGAAPSTVLADTTPPTLSKAAGGPTLHSESLDLDTLPSTPPAIVTLDEPEEVSEVSSPQPSFYDKVHTSSQPSVSPSKGIDDAELESAVSETLGQTTRSVPPISHSSTSSATAASTPPSSKIIIQNSNDASELLKIIGLTVGVIIVTVIAGLGIGYALLSFSLSPQQIAVEPVGSPSPSSSPSTPVSPSPSPSPSAEPVAKDKLQVLVVNATTTAGKAGKYKTLLEQAGFKNISVGNAKGKYEPGTYFLMKAESSALKTELDKALSVTGTIQKSVKTEDAAEQKDLVIVIAE
jgi:hypothetical protein